MEVSQATRRLRTVLVAAVGLALAAHLAGWILTVHHGLAHAGTAPYGYTLEGIYSGPPLLVLSALLAWRRPDHRVTWLFVAITLVAALQSLTGTYAHESLALGESLPATTAALFGSSIAQFSFVVATIVLFHVFPTGGVISPVWRGVLWMVPPLLVLETLALLARAQPYADDPSWLHVTGPLADVWPGWLSGVLGVVTALWIVPLVGSIVHLILRFRRSSGVERQQLRWFVASVVTAVALIAVPLPGSAPDWWNPWAFGPALIWASVGLAILRYRLFELDRIVSRTLAYLLLTGMLVGIYAVGVLGVGALLPGGSSDLVVAGSTLAVAALFRPLRTRIQSTVNRRFNRSGYDASRTVEAFGARLRHELELISLGAELRHVVASTVAPRSVGLWLRAQG